MNPALPPNPSGDVISSFCLTAHLLIPPPCARSYQSGAVSLLKMRFLCPGQYPRSITLPARTPLHRYHLFGVFEARPLFVGRKSGNTYQPPRWATFSHYRKCGNGNRILQAVHYPLYAACKRLAQVNFECRSCPASAVFHRNRGCIFSAIAKRSKPNHARIGIKDARSLTTTSRSKNNRGRMV